MSGQPQRIAKVMPLPVDDTLFTQLANTVADQLDKLKETHGDTLWLKLLESFGDETVDLVAQLKLLAQTPRHYHEAATHHNYRNTFDSHNQNEEFNQHKYEQHYDQQVTNEIMVLADRSDFLPVTTDLIVNTRHIVAFRPQSRRLTTTQGVEELTEREAARLLMLMSKDYNLTLPHRPVPTPTPAQEPAPVVASTSINV